MSAREGAMSRNPGRFKVLAYATAYPDLTVLTLLPRSTSGKGW